MFQKFPLLVVAALCGMAATSAPAEIKTEAVQYKEGDTACEGYLAYDSAVATKAPAVLVIHDWMGVGPYAKGRAEQLAALGYVAFVADIYGKDVRPKDRTEAAEQAGKYKADRATLRRRANAALEQLRKNPHVDPAHIAAIGYCFGGTTVIELARSGADVRGVVSFHGGLDSPAPADGKNIKAKVLVLHGADDPYVKPADLAAFQDEMRTSGVDWQMNSYGDAVHSFTNPGAGTDKSKGNAYQEAADKRSWQAMQDFFGELFGKAKG